MLENKNANIQKIVNTWMKKKKNEPEIELLGFAASKKRDWGSKAKTAMKMR